MPVIMSADETMFAFPFWLLAILVPERSLRVACFFRVRETADSARSAFRMIMRQKPNEGRLGLCGKDAGAAFRGLIKIGHFFGGGQAAHYR